MKTHRHLSLIALSLAFTSLLACGKSNKGETKEVPPQKGQSVAPVELTVPENGAPFMHGFSIDVDQADGKIEYFITQNVDTRITVASSRAKVTGCDPNQVQIQHAWFDPVDSTLGTIVNEGRSFFARAKQRGLLMIVFKGLAGCQHLEYSLVLNKSSLMLDKN